MLRALWFAVKIAALIAAVLWLSEQPGDLNLGWEDYSIRVATGPAMVAALLVLLTLLLIYRLLLRLFDLPRAWLRRQKDKKRERGYRALTRGLSAVAAGDAKQAERLANKARKHLPKNDGLTLLLTAQSAQLNGDEDKARSTFEKLAANKDTAFMGLRGLLLSTPEDDIDRARDLTQKALALQPKQGWVLQTAYNLELKAGARDQARKILKKAVKHGAIEEAQANSDRVAMLLQDADTTKSGEALKYLKQAHKMDKGSIPAALRLANAYLEKDKRRSAKAVITKTWALSPHPDLAALWKETLPEKKAKDSAARLKHFENLLALRPDSAEGQMAVARTALDEKLWGQVRPYLEQAEQMEPSARLYTLWARLEEETGNAAAARERLRQAADAPPDKVWLCRETGRIYNEWSPVALPHGSFNTIFWDLPRPITALQNDLRERGRLLGGA